MPDAQGRYLEAIRLKEILDEKEAAKAREQSIQEQDWKEEARERNYQIRQDRFDNPHRPLDYQGRIDLKYRKDDKFYDDY